MQNFTSSRTRFLYSHLLPDSKRTPTDDDPLGHGTFVASKAVGRINGVARNGILIAVKSTRKLSDVIAALDQTILDVATHGQGRNPSVVVCTLAIKKKWRRNAWMPPIKDRLWAIFRDQLTVLGQMNTVVVISGGNSADRAGESQVSNFEFPKLFRNDETLPVIVASATNQHGQPANWAQSLESMREVWAPGEMLRGATIGDGDRFTECSGSSGTAGVVCSFDGSQIEPSLTVMSGRWTHYLLSRHGATPMGSNGFLAASQSRGYSQVVEIVFSSDLTTHQHIGCASVEPD